MHTKTLCLQIYFTVLYICKHKKEHASMDISDGSKTEERDINPKAIGGLARANSLTSEERKEIAQKAAQARWSGLNVLPKETHTGILKIGDREIPCSVLDNGTRVLSIRGINRVMGSKTTGSPRKPKEGARHLPYFLAADRLKPFISNELNARLISPVEYRPKNGHGASLGYEATLLPEICEVILDANKAGALTFRQQKVADASDLLMRGFARVGIIALIDEATGYQEVRDRKALEAILDRFLAKELAVWAKRFPDEFYQQIFRLKKWQWNGLSVKRPGVVGKYTIDLVYERLAPGIVEELERINPKNEKGNRSHRHHQWLTEDIGHPALAQHLYALIGFMRVSGDWDQFYRMVQRAYPKKNTNMLLPLPEPS
jgi:hypothetical protein